MDESKKNTNRGKFIVIICQQKLFFATIERKQRLDVDDLVKDVPGLREYTDAYKDSDEVLPAKRNRHVAFSYRGSM